MFQTLACSTCSITMAAGGGDAAGWSIFFMLVVVLLMLSALVVFMVRLARLEKKHADPALSDEPIVSEPSN